MKEKVLLKKSLYHGYVEMPKGFEIRRDLLGKDILISYLDDLKFPFSKTWDMLNTYITENAVLKQDLHIYNEKTWGNIYYPSKDSRILQESNCDYVLLYGVTTPEACCGDCSSITVEIHYDVDQPAWQVDLYDNQFIMFPGKSKYQIRHNGKELAMLLTTTYKDAF